MSEGIQTTPDDGDTLAARAALRLERDILSGGLRPGSRLAITDLTSNYGIGATPIREGLSRLVARGLVVAIGNRGFRVSMISKPDLADITRLRLLIEREGARLSLQNGDDEWEAAIIASLHRLRLFVERHGRRFSEGSLEFDALHKGFHTSLIAGCGSSRIREAASNLYDQAYRYRRLMMKKLTRPDAFIAAHEKLADAFLARNQAVAETLLESHIESTLHHVYPEPSKGAAKSDD